MPLQFLEALSLLVRSPEPPVSVGPPTVHGPGSLCENTLLDDALVLNLDSRHSGVLQVLTTTVLAQTVQHVTMC